MLKCPLVAMMAAGFVLLPISSAFSAAPNPTPTREIKLLVDFESDTTVTSDPNGAGETRATINTDSQFVAEGTQSLCLDLSGVGGWHDHYFTIDFAQPIDIQGFTILTMDVYIPLNSLDNGVPEGGWFQFDPRTTTQNRDDAAITEVTSYRDRNLHAGWNHLVWNLKAGTDTRLTQLDFAGNTNEAKPYSGPVYVDNIRLYQSFTGVQPDEKLIQGFNDATVKDRFSGAQTVAINTDPQFVSEGTGSLEIDLTGAEGGWTSDIARADDWGKTVDVSNATALHLDLFVPEGNQPTAWNELGFVVIGEGGEVGGEVGSGGFVPGQWNTLEIPLTPEQAKLLTNVKGIFFIRYQDSAWNGKVYVDALRAVVPNQAPPPTAGG
jgi:hypothetical protein